MKHARSIYVRALFTLTLTIALASFVRDRGELLSNISFWLFLIGFATTLVSERAGLLATIAILGLAPSLHQQFNALAGMHLHSWVYPGADAAVGFIAGWTARHGLRRIDPLLGSFPVGPLLLLHLWIAISSIGSIVRNLWESASATSLRGFAYNLWLVRGISWHDDYYPLTDLFFYSLAFALVFCAWETLIRCGQRLLLQMAATLLAVAALNATFAGWQRLTGLGWASGDLDVEVNALWPDLHSFAALMAMALVLSGGIFATHARSMPARALLALAMALSGAGLLLSGSRATVFIVCAGLAGTAVWAAFSFRGWRRLLPLMVAATVLAAVHVALLHGYRGFSYETLAAAFAAMDSGSLSAALSHRPEIWLAALRMYLASPVFGLGQGAFYRLSAIPEFSRTEALTQLGGSGAHNYFLESFVELGLVACVIALYIFWPFARLGVRNFRLISFYALLGMAIGNLYAHAFLVREMLLLAAIFLGGYLWEVRTHAHVRSLEPEPANAKQRTIIVAFIACLALADFVSSFSRFPFTYGQRCFRENPLEDDGWTRGVFRLQLPHEVSRVNLQLQADHFQLARRGLEVEVAIIEGRGRKLSAGQYKFSNEDEMTRSVSLEVPSSLIDWRYLEVKPSRCYVPLNLGIGYDPRLLGIRVVKIEQVQP